MNQKNDLNKICKLIRYDIVTSTTEAGTGHPTSSLSATELMTTLFFGGFLHYDFDDPKYIFNDRIIFSKGHASPLLYSLYHAAGVLKYEELLKLRTMDSPLEGHPTPRFPYVDVATGSLGQGLSVGIGMALGIKLARKQNIKTVREPKVFILLGDSEMAEGQVWEAMEIASHYKLSNLVAMLDVNRLGQRGETLLGWDLETYKQRASSFGWNTIVVTDGHSIDEIKKAYEKATTSKEKPTMIIVKTKKGKGISFLEDKDNWHGKSVPKDKLKLALKEIGKVDKDMKGIINKPENIKLKTTTTTPAEKIKYPTDMLVATREAYGDALVELGLSNDRVVVLDAEVSNSTFSDKFENKFPDRFFEMYIAEQNMVSVALGISKIGYIPYVSTFAAFLTRAYDQIRMSQYSEGNIKFCGSHVGVSIGFDGSSQMGLEDISMFRSILESIVFYPSDAISMNYLTVNTVSTNQPVYIRSTREKTPILYSDSETFPIGGSKILKQNENDQAVVFTAGITLHEALKAYEILKKDGINITIVDIYSIKPLDSRTINNIANKIKNIIVVEDHYQYGGIGEAVKYVLKSKEINFHHLAVRKIPHSGSPEELLNYEEIDSSAIVSKVKEILQ